MARGLRLVWAAPASVIGLVFAPFFRSRRLHKGILLCEGASWPRRLRWRYRAITFGHVVLCVDDLDDRTLQHEMVHVGQYERWGLLYFLAYGFASIRALIRGGHYYRDNSFEVAARAGETVLSVDHDL